MKRFAVILLAFTMIMVLSACSKTEEITTTFIPEETTAAKVPFTIIEAKDCYNNAGYVELISRAEKSAEYTFTADNSDTVKWRVYIFDEAFDEGFRYISQAVEPVLDGDGKVSVCKGQFVYVYCSVNEFTEDNSDEHAKLKVAVK
ncbi:MAG: hypothetical protein IJM96_04635 [Clostridia bacterium]|nr:hypothetical protein [Clostridia bacterium]MBQ7093257.1 hypothetical protein [Clostridia bacterium]